MKALLNTVSASARPAICLMAILAAGMVSAQGQVARSASELLRIRKLTDLNRDYRQRAPSTGNRTAKPRDWGVFDVTFDTAPEWIDEMTITYTLMFFNDKARQGEKPLSLMTLTATYRDVAQGRDRKAGVVVPPQVLERYGSPIGFAVQLYVAGELAAEQAEMEGSLRGQEEWWKNNTIIDNPMVQKRDGYLVERSKSVFNLVDIDAYEAGI